MLKPDDCGHRALTHRHGGLHGIAADAQKTGGIGNRESTGGTGAGIFAEGVARDAETVSDSFNPRASRTRMTAIETAMRAGWALAVSVSVSSGPFHMMSESFWSSASSTS